MKEKKSISLSFSVVFLIIALIIIVLMSFYIYVDKTKSQSKIKELEKNAANMQESLNVLKNNLDTNNTTNKVENPSNTTASSTEKNKNTNESGNNDASANDIKEKLVGMYFPMHSWPGDAPCINLEKSGKIEMLGNGGEEGTYKINGKILDVVYTSYTEPESSKKFSQNKKETIEIIDSNTIKTSSVVDGETYNEIYVKEELCKKITQKAQECIDNQNNIKVESMGLYEINDKNCIFAAYVNENDEVDLKYIIFNTEKEDNYRIIDVKMNI